MRPQLAAIILVGGITVILWAAAGRHSSYRLHLEAHFADARGLRQGASVNVAGVRVGSVTRVRVRPDLREHPAEVEMLLQTNYDLRIPSDAVVTVESDSLLGEPFAEIDVKNTSGPPLVDGGTLKTAPSSRPTTNDYLECLGQILNHQHCDMSQIGKSKGNSEQIGLPQAKDP
ncbi:MAG TPA: MlaD family protein [Candidatus Angelobacter sp.]|nr:MlaD family protein [Candidatus Angelobacter sp.]